MDAASLTSHQRVFTTERWDFAGGKHRPKTAKAARAAEQLFKRKNILHNLPGSHVERISIRHETKMLAAFFMVDRAVYLQPEICSSESQDMNHLTLKSINMRHLTNEKRNRYRMKPLYLKGEKEKLSE